MLHDDIFARVTVSGTGSPGPSLQIEKARMPKGRAKKSSRAKPPRRARRAPGGPPHTRRGARHCPAHPRQDPPPLASPAVTRDTPHTSARFWEQRSHVHKSQPRRQDTKTCEPEPKHPSSSRSTYPGILVDVLDKKRIIYMQQQYETKPRVRLLIHGSKAP